MPSSRLEKAPKVSVRLATRSGGYKKRTISKCTHQDQPYYAKGMCVNCYHRAGRTKMAWKCDHPHKMHYSKGLCKQCYLTDYYKRRDGQRMPNMPSPTGSSEIMGLDGVDPDPVDNVSG